MLVKIYNMVYVFEVGKIKGNILITEKNTKLCCRCQYSLVSTCWPVLVGKIQAMKRTLQLKTQNY